MVRNFDESVLTRAAGRSKLQELQERRPLRCNHGIRLEKHFPALELDNQSLQWRVGRACVRRSRYGSDPGRGGCAAVQRGMIGKMRIGIVFACVVLAFGAMQSCDGDEEPINIWSYQYSPPYSVSFFSLATADNGDIYAGSLSGIFVSNNDGFSWQYDKSSSTFGLFNRSIALDRSGSTVVGTNSGDFYVKRKGDTAWRYVFNSFLSKRVEIRQLMIDERNNIFIPTYSDDIAAGLWVSKNDLNTFEKKCDGLVFGTKMQGLPDSIVHVVRKDGGGRLYAGTNMGVFYSDNDGDNWKPTNILSTETDVRDIFIVGESLMYAGGKGGIYKSTDRGVAWSLLKKGISSEGLAAGSKGEIISGNGRGETFYSPDYGATWKNYSVRLASTPTSGTFAITVDSTRHVWIAVADAYGIHKFYKALE